MRRQQRLLSDDHEGEDILIWSLYLMEILHPYFEVLTHSHGTAKAVDNNPDRVWYLFCKRREQ